MTGARPAGTDPARQVVERRLAALRAEYETGQATLAEIERQQAFLRERLLMLRGAIQAFDDLHTELTGPDPAGPPPGTPPDGGVSSAPGAPDR